MIEKPQSLAIQIFDALKYSSVDEERIVSLVSEGADLTYKEGSATLLYLAVSLDHSGLIPIFAAAGAPLDEMGINGTPLMAAAYFNYPDCVGQLIAVGAKMDLKDANGHTAMMLAINDGCKRGQKEDYHGIVRQFAIAGAEISDEAISLAANKGEEELATYLVDTRHRRIREATFREVMIEIEKGLPLTHPTRVVKFRKLGM